MNKTQLIEAMAADAGITKAQAKKALDAFMDNVKAALKKGDKVTLIGFGTFMTQTRKARKGRNPRTNKEITIPAKTVVKFKAGAGLKKAL